MNGGGGSGGGGGNKTVFRPSPLQGLKGNQQQTPPPSQPMDWGAPPPMAQPAPPSNYYPPQAPASAPPAQDYGAPSQQQYGTPPSLSPGGPAGSAPLAPSRLAEDDVPLPQTPRSVRNILLTEARPVLALAAGVRAGRVRTPLPQFHREATQAIAQFDRAIQPHYSEEMRQRAKYAVCATIDDIAQNLPNLGTDGAEWARRAMVVQFFQEVIGGDRFWQLVDDMLRYPNDNLDLIELYHACLAAGFEGRFRVMPDGKRRLHEIMSRLYSAMEHVRSLSQVELVKHWKGEKAPAGKPAFWSVIAFASAGAAAVLLLIYILLRLILMSTAADPSDQLGGLIPDEPMSLSREAPPLPTDDSAQASQLKQFLADEIAQNLVVVTEDAQTVRVRTTVGQLFQSGSDALEPGREALFRRIGAAVEGESGTVTIEGHADSDRVSSLQFPDNMSLSQARADVVGNIIRSELSDGSRVVTRGMGESVPIASNDTAEGKSQNRRVEVIVPRRY
jgi:type VI secretion system protein ImpK